MSAWALLVFVLAAVVLARLGKGMFKLDPDRWRGGLVRWVLKLAVFLTATAVLLYGVLRFIWLARQQ
jgi:hypothetical protein